MRRCVLVRLILKILENKSDIGDLKINCTKKTCTARYDITHLFKLIRVCNKTHTTSPAYARALRHTHTHTHIYISATKDLQPHTYLYPNRDFLCNLMKTWIGLNRSFLSGWVVLYVAIGLSRVVCCYWVESCCIVATSIDMN